MSGGLEACLGGVDLRAAGPLQLRFEVNQLREKDRGTAIACPDRVIAFSSSGAVKPELMFNMAAVMPHTPFLAIFENDYEYSIKSFRDGDAYTVSMLEATTTLKEILDGSLSVASASELMLGFHVKRAEAKKGPNGSVIKVLELVVTIICDSDLIPAGASAPSSSNVNACVGNSGAVLVDVTAGADAAANRAHHAARLSCGSTLDNPKSAQAAPVAAAERLPAVAPSEGVVVMGVQIKQEPGVSQGPSQGGARSAKSAGVRVVCPSVAAAGLRPASNGEYGPAAGVTWEVMDHGGALLQKTQTALINEGSAEYQKLMHDGLGTARLPCCR